MTDQAKIAEQIEKIGEKLKIGIYKLLDCGTEQIVENTKKELKNLTGEK